MEIFFNHEIFVIFPVFDLTDATERIKILLDSCIIGME